MISVIVPIYNVEKYIGDCLESLATQSNKDFELIVVNDGSQDRSMQRAQKWLAQIPNVIVIEQRNGGLSAARNAGLEKATGDYVMFLDSDDMLSTDAVQILSKAIDETDADMILYSAVSFVDGNITKHFSPIGDVYSRRALDYPETIRGIDYLKTVLRTNSFIVSACMYAFKRELVTSLRFVEGIIHEDNHFTPAVLLSATSVKVLDDQLYKRRVREGSITTVSITSRNVEGYFYSAKNLEKDLEPHLKDDAYPVYLLVLQRLYQASLATALKTRKLSIVRYWCGVIRFELERRGDIRLSRKFRLLISYPFLITIAWISLDKIKKLISKLLRIR